MSTNLLGIDIGGTKCAVIYGIDHDGQLEIADKVRFDTTDVDTTLSTILQELKGLCAKHGLDASRCLMIGNDPHSDVAVAKTVGMDSFYLQSGQSPRIDPRTSGANYVQAHISLKRLRTRLLGGG